MRHIDSGVLRRLVDEPDAVSGDARRHVANCSRCQTRFTEIEEDARLAIALLATPEFAIDSSVALERVRQRSALRATNLPLKEIERVGSMLTLAQKRYFKPLLALAAAACFCVALVLTPAGTWAQGLLTIFEPKTVVAVPVNLSDLSTLPRLDDYGTYAAPKHPTAQSFATVQEASAAAGIAVLTPTTLPAAVANKSTFRVLPGSSASFTFSAAKAQASAAAQGKQLPKMPTGMDGSTLTFTTHPIVTSVYGDVPAAVGKGEIPSGAGSEELSAKANADSADLAAVASNLPPMVIIVETKAPSVTSTGVSAAQLELYLLAQPGISPGLANTIRAIGDPSSALPIPVPMDKALSHAVTVQNVNGVAVADSTGLGGGIVWEKGGIIYGVAGQLTEKQLLDVANSLH